MVEGQFKNGLKDGYFAQKLSANKQKKHLTNRDLEDKDPLSLSLVPKGGNLNPGAILKEQEGHHVSYSMKQKKLKVDKDSNKYFTAITKSIDQNSRSNKG